MSEEKPKGSGYFAVICGSLFLLAFIGSFWRTIANISPEWIMRMWLMFVAAILLWWGINRIQKGRPDRTVGQHTIDLIIGIVAATFALLSFLKGK